MVGFDALKTEVIARLGNRTDIDARVDRWINYAFDELLLNPRFNFFELDDQVSFQTSNGINQQTLDIAPNLWCILDITDLDNFRHLQRSHFQVLDRVTGTVGQVVRYYRFGMSIFFDPTPDAAYNMRLRFRRRPGDRVSGLDFEGLGTEWEEPVTVLSTVKGFEALDQMDKAQAARQLFEAILPSRMDVPTLEDADAETTIAPVLRYRLG
jgi:hypothetical protein